MIFRYLSHEMRTPLNTVISGLNVMREEMVANGHSQYISDLDDIKASTIVSVEMLNQMLTSDKIQHGNLVLDKSLIRLRRLLDGTLAPFRMQVGHRMLVLCAPPRCILVVD